MTRRSALLAGLGLPLGAMTFPPSAFSKDFWNQRKPEEWTGTEIKELLTKSPWAKDAAIDDRGQYGNLGVNRGAAPRRTGAPGGQQQAGGATNSPSAKIQWKAIVRWESALPIREAMKGAALKNVDDFYVLNLIGNLPSAIPTSDGPQDNAAMAYLKENTTLSHKGDQVHLHHVELAPESPLSPAGILFYFSRMLALMPKDKEAFLASKIGPLDLKCRFALADMMYHGALEL